MEAADWKSAQGLRGNYRDMDADWTVPQVWDGYGAADHGTWRLLCTRQSELVRRHAAPEYLETLATLDFGDEIPRFEEINALLNTRTGWQIVGVPGFLPDSVFFAHLAERRFPVTVWIRTPAEFDYIVEPDIFHDLFGHVPLLADPVFADFMQLYGTRALEAKPLGGTAMLGRLYWYGVEFGLIGGTGGCKAYGAGLLSSPGEIVYALDDPAPRRVPFDMERCLRTGFRIDEYQKTYFVVESYDDLFESFENADLAALYHDWKDEDPLDPAAAYDTH
jgi:phenylalanine-4-hydroxylase